MTASSLAESQERERRRADALDLRKQDVERPNEEYCRQHVRQQQCTIERTVARTDGQRTDSESAWTEPQAGKSPSRLLLRLFPLPLASSARKAALRGYALGPCCSPPPAPPSSSSSLQRLAHCVGPESWPALLQHLLLRLLQEDLVRGRRCVPPCRRRCSPPTRCGSR